MTAQPAFDDSRLDRMEQAALWLQRMREPGADEKVMEAWLDWCQRDPLNQQTFDDMAAVWELTGRLQPAAGPDGVHESGDGPGNSDVRTTRSEVAGAGDTRATGWSRRALVASLAGLGIVAAVTAWWTGQPARDGVTVITLASPVGANRKHTLPDGSVLELGGGTRVAVTMSAQARRVELQEGEVFVTVFHDAARPFSVDAGRLEVVATGTAFNVLLTTGRTTVTVTEGSVDALAEGQDAATPNMRVNSGQQLVYPHDSHHMEVRTVNPRDAIAWRAGMLSFDNVPLGEAIASVNRYTTRKVVFEDPRIGTLPFGGTANVNDIRRWALALPHVEFPVQPRMDVSVTELPDGRFLIAPLPAPSRSE